MRAPPLVVARRTPASPLGPILPLRRCADKLIGRTPSFRIGVGRGAGFASPRVLNLSRRRAAGGVTSVNNRPDRILLVDDMPSIHEDFRRILAPSRGSQSLSEAEDVLFGASAAAPPNFQLDCASSGEEGLNLLRAGILEGRPYVLAFIDMRMPAGWDGIRTIEELWREDPELQVVICTAYSDHPLEQALGRLGSPDRLLVLKKPFDPIEVTQMARALAAKRRLAEKSALHLGNLERVLREVEEAASELRGRNQELEMLAAALTQDLRTPMKAISRLSALLSQELRNHGGDKVSDYLQRLRNGAKVGEHLVEGVLSLTEIARTQLAPELLDLTQIARDLMADARAANPAREVSVSVQEGLRAWGDRGLVRVVLKALLDNSWKFTAQQQFSAITVGANLRPDGEIVYFVRDSGCGFEPARAPDLFRKFQRLHGPGEFAGGGVGLLAVGRIIERHRGRVWAESQPGKGTTVHFTLPSPVASPGERQ